MVEHLQGPVLNTFAESKPTELSSEKLSEKSEKKPTSEQKLFFWDNIIFYLASAILGLTISNIVVDFLRPEPNSVACFSSFNDRDQAAYVNNYCNDFLPFSENFVLFLVIHGILLLAPHYLWKVYFSARIDFFFTHAAKLETLRDRDTGEYPHENFKVVDYMHREFIERKDILIGYIIKLSLQLFVAVLAISTTAGLFQDDQFKIQFDCPCLDDEADPIFWRVKCSYAKLRFVSILRIADYIFLGLSVIIIVYGLYWCLLRSHPELGHQETSQFCYDSCINSKHYVSKKWYRLQNDLHFLLVSLFATNAGLGRVFKSIQIANDISQELSAHLESLDNYDSMKHPQREADMAGNSENMFKNGSFAKIMFEICKEIYNEQKLIMDDVSKMGAMDDVSKMGAMDDVSKMGAMDIGCGYHSYLFAIARCQKQVISIILDPYYTNQTKIFKHDEYHAGVILMRIPTNLFGLPKQHKKEFSKVIRGYSGLNEPPDVEQLVIKLSLVVIGPLDSDRKSNTVNQIIEMHSRSPHYFKKGSIMLIFRPLEVEGKKVTGFVDWKPESKKFWEKTSSYAQLKNWLSDNDSVIVEEQTIEGDDHNEDDLRDGVINILCGNVNCKFGIKTYRYVGYTENHPHTAV